MDRNKSAPHKPYAPHIYLGQTICTKKNNRAVMVLCDMTVQKHRINRIYALKSERFVKLNNHSMWGEGGYIMRI